MLKANPINPLPDFSDVFTAVEAAADEVNTLHSVLDGFAEGRTQQLAGSRVRDAVYASLAGLDAVLSQLHAMKTAGEQQTRGAITASLVATLEQALHNYQLLNRVLYDIYADRAGHNISATQHANITASLLALDDSLLRMVRSLGLHSLTDAPNAD